MTEGAVASVVLVQPKFAGNVGAVARLLANFGLEDLVIVAPRCDPLDREALDLSSRAKDLLRAARIVDDLREALDGVVRTIGTSCRPGMYREQVRLLPNDLHGERQQVRGPVALVFGPEDHGLTNDHLLLCDEVVCIPTEAQYPSLNLSHAVAIVLYEWSAGQRPAKSSPTPVRELAHHTVELEEAADAAVMTALTEKLRESLGTIGYLHPKNPDGLIFALKSIFSRARLSQQEAQILIGLAQQIQVFAETGSPHHPPNLRRD